MKKMKKILAMVLAMAMVLGMSLTVFAAEEVPEASASPAGAKITVTNVPLDATVTYKQIAVAAPTTPIGWSLAEDVILSNNVTLEQLVTVGGGNADAEAGTINSNDIVAKAIANITLDGTATLNQAAEGAEVTSAEIANVTPGLYVIEVQKTGYTFTRMLAYVAWNNNNTAAVDTNVVAKGAPNQVEKEITALEGDSHLSVSAGDVVPYTVTTQYPYLAQTIEKPSFVITDTVSGGTIQGIPEVKIGGEEATANDVTIVVNEAKDGFTATFKYNIANASKEVEVKYNVVVAEGENPLENNVTSKFSSATGGEETTTTAKVITPKVIVEFSKISDDENPIALAGATFALYEETSEQTATHMLVDGKIVEKADVEEGTTVTYVKEFGTVTTVLNAEGTEASAEFVGLDAEKNYWMVETQAPDGYSLDDTVRQLTGATVTEGVPTLEDGVLVTRNTATDFTVNGGEAIKNTKLSALPSTGGIGTTIFTIGGCAIMVVAAGLFFATRKKSTK